MFKNSTIGSKNENGIVAYIMLAAGLCSLLDFSRAESYISYGNLMERDQDFFQATYLYDIRQGSELSDEVYGFRGVPYESALGDAINLDKFYKTNWTDFSLTWVTKLDDGLGLIWGGSTGEYGEKYKIYPKFKFGFIYQTWLSKSSKLSIYATSYLGGMLREKTCQGDYGEIGGVQTVNCRLAGSTLKPSDTLKYLLNKKPRYEQFISISYNLSFN
ncbi:MULTISPECIES: hypothetical protein [Deefgea]|uniref:Outer membrane protein n=1 Tax=Deefgea chitinilytica TaxID=570276 RepID=A0ABS2C9B2_9NEIS|nr:MULTISPECIES: hypothetical protein [Deefgea]MBM5570723.1 hypothetical protein [Deefgea chitinilytica]MBM9887952.1 hypothetical protein [Deefgea sp. CFH1-16]